MTALRATWRSPIGELLLAGDGQALHALHLAPTAGAPAGGDRRDGRTSATPFAAAIGQLEGYFAGRRTEFELDLAPRGGRLDRAVWAEVARIPYGETRSYGEVARAVGRPDRVRAVAAAIGRNPLAIVVPCHRVIGSDGSLTGYAGGLDRKRALLALERGAWQQRLPGFAT